MIGNASDVAAEDRPGTENQGKLDMEDPVRLD